MVDAKRLLIVDDSEIDRKILRNILSKYFEITEVENGYAALELFTKRTSLFDAVLLDISMPVLDGFNVLDIMSENDINIPILLVTAEATAANVHRAAKYSVAGFISKPFEPKLILEKLSTILGMEKLPLEEVTRQEIIRKTETDETDTYISKLSTIFKTFLKNIDMDDSPYYRVSKLMEILLVEYGISNRSELDTLDIRIISKAAFFCDIGLMGIPSELITRKEKLTGSQQEIYNSHTNLGANIIWLNNSDNINFFVKICSDMCMHHHERFDGLGYPHGLKGSDNSIYSQLCGLAIRFDTLFSNRRDINSIQFDFVINELKLDRGAFSPELIDILIKCRGEILSYYKVLDSNNYLTV